MDVQRDIDGDLADLHLDSRAIIEVEAAQVDVVAEPFAVLVIDKEARRRGEHFARLLVRGGVEQLAIDADVAQAARGRRGDAPDEDGYGAARSRDLAWLRRRACGALRWQRRRRARLW